MYCVSYFALIHCFPFLYFQATSSNNGFDKLKYTDSPFSFLPLPINAVPNSSYTSTFLTANKTVFSNLYTAKKDLFHFESNNNSPKNEKKCEEENEKKIIESNNEQKKTKNNGGKSAANISEVDKSVADLCDIVKTAVTDYNR